MKFSTFGLYCMRITFIVVLLFMATLFVGYPVLLAQRMAAIEAPNAEVERERTNELGRRIGALELAFNGVPGQRDGIVSRLVMVEARGELNSDLLRALLGGMGLLVAERAHSLIRRRRPDNGGDDQSDNRGGRVFVGG